MHRRRAALVVWCLCIVREVNLQGIYGSNVVVKRTSVDLVYTVNRVSDAGHWTLGLCKRLYGINMRV